jgi:CheY-like chemotaxis protein
LEQAPLRAPEPAPLETLDSREPAHVRATKAPPDACILFVDDENELRAVAEQCLTSAGYRVLLAKHGAEALELLKEQRHSIDVIVLDMTMPVMGGVQVVRELREQQVEIPVVASSGYSEAEINERFGRTNLHVLHKPYRPTQLVASVAAALNAPFAAQYELASDTL